MDSNCFFSQFPDGALVSTLRLARCGYYYTGQGRECRCYFCGSTHSDWSCEISHEPDCAQGMDYRNTPVPREEPPMSTSQLSGGLIIEEVPENQFETPGSPLTHGNQHPPHINEDSFTSGVPVSISRSVLQSSTFHRFTDRLSTFTYWPSQIAQRPVEMSSAGFYYTGVGDRVRCAFCGGELGKWESTDIPFHEHLRWFPDCPFIKECFQEYIPSVHESPRDGSAIVSTEIRRKVVQFGFNISDVNNAVDDLIRHIRLQEITALEIMKYLFKDGAVEFPDCDIIGPCVVCARENRCTLFFPCTHICCCRRCGERCCLCPFCRTRIKARVRTYI
ncbi:baculoviral IAP repeat-containing protein 7-like [Ostrea edulis]|uniref:baculoviral IAP repeat-containing protein 7-like n=1 Tax=Ostrea edulis TaxID=37623 RepID=UPI0024AFD07A|nr:baculoviral IAP repeat-containing protein 7-like [Ostrea edulis]